MSKQMEQVELQLMQQRAKCDAFKVMSTAASEAYLIELEKLIEMLKENEMGDSD